MVREGYKETELGEIPEDWDIKIIGINNSPDSGGFTSLIVFRDITFSNLFNYCLALNQKYPINAVGKAQTGRYRACDWIF